VTAENGTTKKTYTVSVDRKSYEGTCGLAVEDCLGIDPTTVKINVSGGSTQIVEGPTGNHLIKTLPGDAAGQAEGAEVVKIIKFYGFNQECFIGRGTSGIMEYWKTSGEIPVGAY